MLLVKLVFGAEINIVTTDPLKDEKYRGREYSQRAFHLIDFLDEVGCRVFFARDLHSTLILTNVGWRFLVHSTFQNQKYMTRTKMAF